MEKKFFREKKTKINNARNNRLRKQKNLKIINIRTIPNKK